MVLAHLALTLALVAPQDQEPGDPRLTSALSSSEQGKLNKLAKKWFEEWKKYEDEEDVKKRGRLGDKRDKARDKFMKEWTAKSKKEPLKHVGDLLAIFDNVFPYEKQSGTGEIKTMAQKGGGDYEVVVPKGYKHEQRYTTVLLVPPLVDEQWVENKQHFGATWRGVEEAEDWLFVMPQFAEGLDFEPIPDLSSTTGDAMERDRIGAMLMPLGRAQQTFRFDRNHLFLDASSGSTGFALRMASYFPTRFAGLILRGPQLFGTLPEDGDEYLRKNFRYESMTGLPVLLIKDEATAENCSAIAKVLNDLQPGSCQIMDADDSELAVKIAGWVAGNKRDLFRKQVVVAPNHDSFRKAFWVQVDTAEPVEGPLESRPFVKAEADRDGNRIIIEARNVASLQLLLNDAIVDLDQDFTVVINGEAVTEKLERSFSQMMDFLTFSLFDCNRLWTATYRTTVPKPDSSGGGDEEGDDPR